MNSIAKLYLEIKFLTEIDCMNIFKIVPIIIYLSASVALAQNAQDFFSSDDRSEEIKRTRPSGIDQENELNIQRARFANQNALISSSDEQSLRQIIDVALKDSCIDVKNLRSIVSWVAPEELVRQKQFQLKNFDISCIAKSDLFTLLANELYEIKNKGYLIYRLELDKSLTDEVKFILYATSLSEMKWDDGDVNVVKYGWTPIIGEPLIMYDLDELIERLSRLKSHQPKLDIEVSMDGAFAKVQVFSERLQKHHIAHSLQRQLNRLNITTDLQYDEPLNNADSLLFTNSINEIGSNKFVHNAISYELPLSNIFFGVHASESEFTARDADESIYFNREKNINLSAKKNIYRDSKNIFSLTGSHEKKVVLSKYDDAVIPSQSPSIDFYGINANWQYITRGGTFVNLNYQVKKGRGGSVNIDNINNDLFVNEFVIDELSGSYLTDVEFLNRNYRWINMAHVFHSDSALTPSMEYGLSSFVEGLFKTSSLTDRGLSLRTGLSTAFMWEPLGRPVRLASYLGWGKGRRYADKKDLTVYSVTFESEIQFAKTRLITSMYLPGNNAHMQNERPSVGVVARYTW